MSAVGPKGEQARALDAPSYSVAVNLASDFDLTGTTSGFNAGFARELFVGVGGTVIAQLYGDAAPQTYQNVPPGSTLSGLWTLVKSTANGTTASGIIARY